MIKPKKQISTDDSDSDFDGEIVVCKSKSSLLVIKEKLKVATKAIKKDKKKDKKEKKKSKKMK